MSRPPLRIVVADDERMVRTALRVILEAEPDMEVVGEAASGAEAVSVVRSLAPDVVLMDVRMPETDGIRATEQILRTMASPPRIVVVTTFENDAYVYDALRAGAAGFLLKRADPDELIGAVRLVARGDSLLFPAAVRNLAAAYAAATPPAAPGWAARLTEREADVLRLMATGLSNHELSERLGVGPQTVKTHVASVLAKTGSRDRTQAVIAAYEGGFIMKKD
ncbi:response regulator [Streptomyces sp. NPDC054904]|uniref:response regulator n=1 Tax=unclassified Streptomyces TaxID=2593676 RepID=UPI002481F3C5|nr:response regulator transcription factor [Streptomyces sp. Isolate_45]MDA5282101.1 response regulator transcription factor [Streptomyces sp. Isolate_45]